MATATNASSTAGSGPSRRVIARTAEYPIAPDSNAAASTGRRRNSCATRSFSNAVARPIFNLQHNQATHVV
jgi:hypothetical protein